MKKIFLIILTILYVSPIVVMAAEGDITRYSMGPGPGYMGLNYPNAIAFDGTNLWVATDQDSDKNIHKVSLNGLILGSYPVPNSGAASGPMDMAFDGTNMWIANWCWGNGTSGSVVKVSPTGATDVYTYSNHQPIGIAFDGTNMWTTAGASVGKISPTGALTRYPMARMPWGIAFDGTNMWTADVTGRGVTKVSPSGVMTSYSTGKRQDQIAFDGTNMWTTSWEDGSVSKVTPTGGVTSYIMPPDPTLGAPILDDIAFDGTNMWVAYWGFVDWDSSTWPNDRVVRISPTGDMQTYIGTGNESASIISDGAYGADLWNVTSGSRMWTADYRGNGISRIGTESVIVANCGPANGVSTASALAPTPATPPNNLCTSGTVPVVTDIGASFDWTCDGPDGADGTADDVACSAPKIVPSTPLSCAVNNTTILDTAQAWSGSWYAELQAIERVGNYIYAGGGDTGVGQVGLYIYDVSDPENITQQSFFSTHNPPSVQNNTWGNDVLGVNVEGEYAYLMTYYGGLVIVDISNPAIPTFVGKVVLHNLNAPGSKETWDVEVVGNYAFLAAGKGLIVVDVSNKANPVFVANLDLGADVSQEILVSGNYAYIAMRSFGFSVVDISNPLLPTEVLPVTDGYNSSSWAYSLASKGNYLYVGAHYAEEVKIYNISNPSSPVLVGSVPTPIVPVQNDSPRELYVAGDVLYVGAGRGGVYVFDITNPSTPAELIYIDNPPLLANAKVWGVVPLADNDFTRLAFVSEDTAAGLYTTETICDPQPDLTATFNPAVSFTTGTAVTLTGVVTNSGTSDISTGFSDNLTYRYGNTGSWLSFAGNTVSHVSLNETLSANDSFTFTPPSTGTDLYLQYCVDSNMINAYGEVDEGTGEGNNCVERGPFTVTAPLSCSSGELLTWTEGSDSCMANATSDKNSGETLTISDVDPNPSTGTANFTCRADGTWDPVPSPVSCSIPVTPIVLEINASPKIIRSGETAAINIAITSIRDLTCTVYNANNTPETINHIGSATQTIYPPIITDSLTSTRIVSISCSVVLDPSRIVNNDVRIEVVPTVQEI